MSISSSVSQRTYSDIDGVKASAACFDVSSMYQLGDNTTIGIAFQNIGSSVKFVQESYELPVSIKLGAAYRAGSVNLALDVDALSDSGNRTALGLEYSYVLNKDVKFMPRLGLQTGNDISNGISFGLGFRYSSYQLDYSWTPEEDFGNIQRFSFSVNF